MDRNVRINRQMLLIFVVAVLCLHHTGCTEKKDYEQKNHKPVIGVITKSRSSEYWMTVVSGMEMAASELGMEIVFFSPDTELEKEVQDRLAESLLLNQVDVLAISPIDSYSEPDYLDQAEEKNIPVISFDTRFEGTEIPYIGVDNELVGYELGKELATQMGHQGEVGIIAGDFRQSGHRKRVDGFLRYMKTEKQMKIAFTESGYANLQVSEQKVKEIFENYPAVEGIFATSAVTALGIAQATDGNQVKIVTVDEQKDVLDAVKQNKIAAVANQAGDEIGYETIRYIDQVLCGKEPEAEVLPVQIVTKENMGDLLQ